MPTREEMIASLKAQDSQPAKPSREEMIASLKAADQRPSREEMIAKLQEADAKPAPSMSKTESAVAGFGQGGSFGFGDEISGGIGVLADKIGLDYAIDRINGVPAELSGDPDKSIADSYRESRDYARQYNKDARTSNPKTYLAGEVGGAITTGLITGGAAPASLTGRAALEGAAYGLGAGEADLTQGDFKGVAKDVAIGGTIGAISPHLTKGAGKLASKTGNLVKKTTDVVIGTTKDAGKDAVRGAAKILGIPESELTPEIVEQLKKYGLGFRGNKDKILKNIDADIAAEIENIKTSPDVAKESLLNKLDTAYDDAVPRPTSQAVEKRIGPAQKVDYVDMPMDQADKIKIFKDQVNARPSVSQESQRLSELSKIRNSVANAEDGFLNETMRSAKDLDIRDLASSVIFSPTSGAARKIASNRTQLYSPEINKFTKNVSDKFSNAGNTLDKVYGKLANSEVRGTMIQTNINGHLIGGNEDILSKSQGTKYRQVFSEDPQDTHQNAVRHMLLMQKDPEYQKLMQEEEDNNR